MWTSVICMLAFSGQLVPETTHAGALILPCEAFQAIENPAQAESSLLNPLDHMGSALALGDWNGDIYPDLAVGGLMHLNNAAANNRVFIYLGESNGGFAATPAVILDGNGHRDQLGFALTFFKASPSDTTDTLAVGAPAWPNTTQSNRKGRVYLFQGETVPNPFAGLERSADDCAALILEGDVQGSRFGETLVAIDDLDGDTHPDLLIGAPGSDDSVNAYEGRVHTLRGALLTTQSLALPACRFSPAVVSATNTSVFDVPALSGANGQDRFGDSISSAGDLAGTLANEVLIGASQFHPIELQQEDDTGSTSSGPGYAQLFTYDSTSGFSSVLTGGTVFPGGTASAPSGQHGLGSLGPGEATGRSVAAGMDLDADGVPDIAIGSPLYRPNGAAQTGRVRVYSGALLQANPGTPSAALLGTLEGENPDSQFSSALGSMNGPPQGSAPFRRDRLLIGAQNDSIQTDGLLPSSFGAVPGPEPIHCPDPSYVLTPPGQLDPMEREPQGGFHAGSLFIVDLIGTHFERTARVVGEAGKDHMGRGFVSGYLGGNDPALDAPDLLAAGFAWSHPDPNFPSPGSFVSEAGRVYVFHGDSHPLASTWTNLGHALGGGSGAKAPRLVGSGQVTLAGGGNLSLVLDLSPTPHPNLYEYLFISASAIYAPFKGGILVPNNAPGSLITLSITVNALGYSELFFDIPADPISPAYSLFFHLWMKDDTGTPSAVWLASNALQVDVD